MRAEIERASPIDLMELASAVTPAAGQVGAMLLLEHDHRLELETVRSALDRRIRTVPRLRQRLRPTPFGCGRPIWVDDAAFDITHHVVAAVCPPPGDRAAMLEVAADLLARPLPGDRPLWSATLLTGLADGSAALILRFHHVMADGMGGLAMLASLVDGVVAPAPSRFPRPPPTRRSLFVDAWRARLAGLSRLGEIGDRVRGAVTEISSRPPRAARCALNRPVGARRRLAVARTDLAAIHAAARIHGASINDAVLAAITGALAGFLRDLHEHVDHLVVSIPVSGRDTADTTELGNQIGVMALQLPTGGSPGDRIEAIADVTRTRKQADRGASAALLAPMFRLLASVHLLRWFTERQRMVHTFVTNLRGPDDRVHFLGATVAELIPVNSTSGNVRVAFGVFSYAGELTVTVVADDSLGDDLPVLVEHLHAALESIAASG